MFVIGLDGGMVLRADRIPSALVGLGVGFGGSLACASCCFSNCCCCCCSFMFGMDCRDCAEYNEAASPCADCCILNGTLALALALVLAPTALLGCAFAFAIFARDVLF